jgi:hypothetical protein
MDARYVRFPLWFDQTDQEGNLNTELAQNGAPAGAFAIPRPGDNNSNMNTYAMWQDKTGILQVNWQDDGGGWKGPQRYPR